MIKLGSVARDIITGFEGLVTGRHEFLTGCSKVTLQPRKLDDKGKPAEGQWFDEQHVEVLEQPRILFENGDTPGGPSDMPREASAPKR